MTCQLCGSTRTALAITRDGRAYCSNVAGCKDRQAAAAAELCGIRHPRGTTTCQHAAGHAGPHNGGTKVWAAL